MQTAIIFRNVDNGVTTFSTAPNKTSHSVLVVAIPDVLPLHVTHEGHIAVYVGKEKKMLDDILSTDQDFVEARPYVTWKEESGTYSLPLKITWDGLHTQNTAHTNLHDTKKCEAEQTWKIVMVSEGGTKRDFRLDFATESEAEQDAAEAGWSYVDENWFEWRLEVEEDLNGVKQAAKNS